MGVFTLLKDFEKAGGSFAVEDGQMKVQYPDERREAIAPILDRLRQHKAEVILLLQERSARNIPAPQPFHHKAVRARIIGQERTAVSDKAEECWHCSASGRCGCAACGTVDKFGRDVPGECRSCRGTGYLAWEAVQ